VRQTRSIAKEDGFGTGSEKDETVHLQLAMSLILVAAAKKWRESSSRLVEFVADGLRRER